MVCREMCCEMKNLARDAYLYPHRKCVYKSAADPGGSALARAPPLDRGKDTRAPCYYDNGQACGKFSGAISSMFNCSAIPQNYVITTLRKYGIAEKVNTVDTPRS